MKLIQKLAFATTGVAILIAVGTKPANAGDFSVLGTFNDSFLEGSSPFLESLKSFDGIYSVEGELPVNTPVSLTSWNVNVRDELGNVVFNFNNLTQSGNASISPFSLDFQAGTENLNLFFPQEFDGSGTTNDGLFRIDVPPDKIGFSIGRFVDSATSRPRRTVPEPNTISALVLAGGAVLLMKRKVETQRDV
jgi:hypothetical protein